MILSLNLLFLSIIIQNQKNKILNTCTALSSQSIFGKAEKVCRNQNH